MTTVRNQHEDCISGRKDSKKLIITLHIAWASVEARNRLIQIRTVSGSESTMPKLPASPCMIAIQILLELMIC